MATPAKRALDFDQLEQKSRTDTISEAIKEVDVTQVDDTKVNTSTTNKKAAVEETNKTKSPVNYGSKTKIKPMRMQQYQRLLPAQLLQAQEGQQQPRLGRNR